LCLKQEVNMGLLNVLEGMSDRPSAGSVPSGKGGMSPIAMGLLALLAYKAFRGGGASGSGTSGTAGEGGGLMAWLRGELGGA
jgi:hypothetical protein